MGGQVVGPEVGLDFDQASGEPPSADLANEDLAEKIPRYREGVAVEEVEVEGAFDPSSFPSRAICRARRATCRRLSR
jgi:hypothetical protein